MPLKHDTETRLTILLGAMIALAGCVCAFLPPVSVSVWPWGVSIGLSVAYPLLLYPFLQSRRADTPFRLLHFFPAFLLLLWVLLELIASAVPAMQIWQTIYTLGWSAAGVLVGFALLIAFCVRVLRQRTARIFALLTLLVLFLALGTWSDKHDWDRLLATTLWNGRRFAVLDSGATGNLLHSSDPLEEQWRIELRLMEQRRMALVRGATGSLADVAVRAPERGAHIASTVVRAQTGTELLTPPHLPTSGFGMETLVLVCAAGACTAVHHKSMRRSRG